MTTTNDNKKNATSAVQKTSAAAADVTRRMMCGGCAGMIAKTATNPLDRIRMLAQTGEHGIKTTTTSTMAGGTAAARGGGAAAGVMELYRNILEKEGILGLWAGNGANLLRVFPAKAVVFASNDFYKQGLQLLLASNLKDDRHHRQPSSSSSSSSSSSPPPLSTPMAFLAGGLSGMTATAATYPLDLARGRISGKLATGPTNRKEYSGIVRTMALTVRDEGIVGLYRGVTPTLLGAMPYEGIKFGTVGLLEHAFPLGDDERPTATRKMWFGGAGGVMAGLITYPNDTVRRLLQLQGSRGTSTQFTGYWDCARQTYRRHGIGRFYRGVTLNVIRMAPNTAIQFYSYEILKNLTVDWKL